MILQKLIDALIKSSKEKYYYRWVANNWHCAKKISTRTGPFKKHFQQNIPLIPPFQKNRLVSDSKQKAELESAYLLIFHSGTRFFL